MRDRFDWIPDNLLLPLDKLRALNRRDRTEISERETPHVHQHWELKAIGPDETESDWEAQTPTLVVIPPETVHAVTPPARWRNGFSVSMTRPLASFVTITDGRRRERFCLFEKIDALCPGGALCVLEKFAALRARDLPAERLAFGLNALLNVLLFAIKAALEADGGEGGLSPSVTERAINYMQRCYYRPTLTVEEVASKVGVTAGHLANLFKRERLGAARQFIVSVRLENAMKLLKTGRYAVKEVAAITGWNSQFYFSNAFRRRYKIPPSEVKVEPQDAEER